MAALASPLAAGQDGCGLGAILSVRSRSVDEREEKASRTPSGEVHSNDPAKPGGSPQGWRPGRSGVHDGANQLVAGAALAEGHVVAVRGADRLHPVVEDVRFIRVGMRGQVIAPRHPAAGHADIELLSLEKVVPRVAALGARLGEKRLLGESEGRCDLVLGELKRCVPAVLLDPLTPTNTRPARTWSSGFSAHDPGLCCRRFLTACPPGAAEAGIVPVYPGGRRHG